MVSRSLFTYGYVSTVYSLVRRPSVFHSLAISSTTSKTIHAWLTSNQGELQALIRVITQFTMPTCNPTPTSLTERPIRVNRTRGGPCHCQCHGLTPTCVLYRARTRYRFVLRRYRGYKHNTCGIKQHTLLEDMSWLSV